MYELIKVANNAYYIDCPSKIGIVRIGENSAVLIDSGSDKDSGKKVLRALQGEGLTVSAILNTHSHADHIGGNKIIFQRTGCKIYAKGIEAVFTEYPILEPSHLYGAKPPKELCTKFLLAEGTHAEPLNIDVLPKGMEIIPLPGHSFDMVGFKTDEGIAYIADALSSKETLDKYKIGFVYDVASYISTLEHLKTMEAELFIPSHAEPTDNIRVLAQYNIDAVNGIADKIEDLTVGGIGFDELVGRLFLEYALNADSTQHALVGSSVKAYLTYLIEFGRVRAEYDKEITVFVKN